MRSRSADFPLPNAPEISVWLETSKICRKPYQFTAMTRVREIRCALMADSFAQRVGLQSRRSSLLQSVERERQTAPIPPTVRKELREQGWAEFRGANFQIVRRSIENE